MPTAAWPTCRRSWRPPSRPPGRRALPSRACRRRGGYLQLLAGGIGEGVIGETGTGCGVGLAWLASGARAGVRLVSVEIDWVLADVARDVFAGMSTVTILHGDWSRLRAAGPFRLLALDGGGQGKGAEAPLCPREWLRPGGTLVIDRFTPASRGRRPGWPARHRPAVLAAASRTCWPPRSARSPTRPRSSRRSRAERPPMRPGTRPGGRQLRTRLTRETAVTVAGRECS